MQSGGGNPVNAVWQTVTNPDSRKTQQSEEKKGKSIMTNYEIRENYQFNSREVYFDGKPSRETLNALKALKMRWNRVKSCWYGFAQECDLINAIITNDRDGEDITGEKTEGATVYTDGYLGGGAVYGSKSDKHLYGADLSKAIREDIKAAGIKGASVRCKSYSGGQSITVTLSLPASAYVSKEQFAADYRIPTSANWIYYEDEDGKGQTMSISDYYSREISAAKQEKIRISAAVLEYRHEAESENDVNYYHIDKYKVYTPETMEILKKVNAIISAYRYDESNAMVDYFDTNFYYTICTKPTAK